MVVLVVAVELERSPGGMLVRKLEHQVAQGNAGGGLTLQNEDWWWWWWWSRCPGSPDLTSTLGGDGGKWYLIC